MDNDNNESKHLTRYEVEQIRNMLNQSFTVMISASWVKNLRFCFWLWYILSLTFLPTSNMHMKNSCSDATSRLCLGISF